MGYCVYEACNKVFYTDMLKMVKSAKSIEELKELPSQYTDTKYIIRLSSGNEYTFLNPIFIGRCNDDYFDIDNEGYPGYQCIGVVMYDKDKDCDIRHGFYIKNIDYIRSESMQSNTVAEEYTEAWYDMYSKLS